MENKKVIAVIDLGTYNLKCAIFSFSSDGLPQLIGFSKKKTKGIHNSIIVNINEAIAVSYTHLTLPTNREV